MPSASSSVFTFCASVLIFGGNKGDPSHFHVVRSRTHFRRCRGRRVPFSCFVLPDSFSAAPRASDPVFMFCAPELVFGGTEGVESRFHVLRYQTHFQRYKRCRVPFLCFARPESFSAVPRALGLVFKFCAPGLLFDGTEGVGSRFHILRAMTHFQRYRGRHIPFLCLLSRTRFRRYRGRPFPFSCFLLRDMFSTVPRASGSFFMFCTPGLIFGGTRGVGSCFLVLHARTRFRRFRGHRVPFSCFARPYTFSVVPRASGPVFMFCAPGLVLSGTGGIVSRFLVLRARTIFRQFQGC
jgi:hypothetical protein